MCVFDNLYSWSELSGGSRPFSSTTSGSDTHTHRCQDTSSPFTCQLLSLASLAVIPVPTNKQENISSRISLQWEDSCPTQIHTQTHTHSPGQYQLCCFQLFLKCEIEPRCSIKQWEQGDGGCMCAWCRHIHTGQNYSCQL